MFCNILTSLFLSLVQVDGNAYPRAEFLIEVAALASPDSANKYRIVDTRSRKEWEQGHLPASVNVTMSDWSKRFTSGPEQKWWEQELGRLGIDVDVPVVIYGDDIRETARAWWILRYWGIKDVRILNGGFSAWTSTNNPLEKATGTKVALPPKATKLIPADQRLATKEQIKDSLKDKLLQIIDTRSDGEFCGDTKLAKQGGAIPGAVHLEWKVLVDSKTEKFKSRGELEQLFKKAGIDLTKPSAAHCQSGGRSSVMVFAMELMGATDVRNYYRSWAEWGNATDTPIVIPPKKTP